MKIAGFQLLAFNGNVVAFTRAGRGKVSITGPGFTTELENGDDEALWNKVYHTVAPVIYGSLNRGKAGVVPNATNSMVKDLQNEIERLFW
jgi:hypothetical protein